MKSIQFLHLQVFSFKMTVVQITNIIINVFQYSDLNGKKVSICRNNVVLTFSQCRPLYRNGISHVGRAVYTVRPCMGNISVVWRRLSTQQKTIWWRHKLHSLGNGLLCLLIFLLSDWRQCIQRNQPGIKIKSVVIWITVIDVIKYMYSNFEFSMWSRRRVWQ